MRSFPCVIPVAGHRLFWCRRIPWTVKWLAWPRSSLCGSADDSQAKPGRRRCMATPTPAHRAQQEYASNTGTWQPQVLHWRDFPPAQRRFCTMAPLGGQTQGSPEPSPGAALVFKLAHGLDEARSSAAEVTVGLQHCTSCLSFLHSGGIPWERGGLSGTIAWRGGPGSSGTHGPGRPQPSPPVAAAAGWLQSRCSREGGFA